LFRNGKLANDTSVDSKFYFEDIDGVATRLGAPSDGCDTGVGKSQDCKDPRDCPYLPGTFMKKNNPNHTPTNPTKQVNNSGCKRIIKRPGASPEICLPTRKHLPPSSNPGPLVGKIEKGSQGSQGFSHHHFRIGSGSNGNSGSGSGRSSGTSDTGSGSSGQGS
jgi:hypothetical protein